VYALGIIVTGSSHWNCWFAWYMLQHYWFQK